MPWPNCSDPISIIASAPNMTTECGLLSKACILQNHVDGGCIGIGFALAFIQTAKPHIFEYGIIVVPYEISGPHWVPIAGKLSVCRMHAVVGGAPYTKVGAEAIAVLVYTG